MLAVGSGKGYRWHEAAEDAVNNRDADELGRLALPSRSVCSGDVIAVLPLDAGKRRLVRLCCWG